MGRQTEEVRDEGDGPIKSYPGSLPRSLPLTITDLLLTREKGRSPTTRDGRESRSGEVVERWFFPERRREGVSVDCRYLSKDLMEMEDLYRNFGITYHDQKKGSKINESL